MASVIVKFPDNRTEKKDIISAYKEVSGTEYIIFNTHELDENQHKITGISYKTKDKKEYANIIEMEEWKKAKEILVNDLHDKKENFEYFIPETEILVTEDFMHKLALRETNYAKLEINYESFLSSQEKGMNEIPSNTSILNNSFEETVNLEMPTINPTPIMENTSQDIVSSPISASQTMEFPEVQNQIVDVPVISPTNEEQVVNEFAKKMPNNSQGSSSSVENTYIENIDSMIEQMKKISDEYIKQMEQMKTASIEEFKQIKELKKLAEETVKKAETVMANASNSYLEKEQVLSKVA